MNRWGLKKTRDRAVPHNAHAAPARDHGVDLFARLGGDHRPFVVDRFKRVDGQLVGGYFLHILSFLPYVFFHVIPIIARPFREKNLFLCNFTQLNFYDAEYLYVKMLAFA